MTDLERATEILGRVLPARMTPLLMNIADALATARAVERTACAAIAREFCQIGDSDILREGDARRIYERILARGEVTR